MNKKMLRSIWAVVAGILTVVLFSVGSDKLLEASGFFPPATQGLYNPTLLGVALAYRTIYAFAGGYATAKLAPSNPTRHVVILLIFGTVMGILGVIGGWNLSQHWYPIALVFTSGLGVWFGGQLCINKR